MSGGAYYYVYCRDVIDLLERRGELYEIIKSLNRYDYEDIAKDTQEFIHRIENIKTQIQEAEKYRKTLKNVFKAVEWYESGDYSKDTMIEILEGYRKSKLKKILMT